MTASGAHPDRGRLPAVFWWLWAGAFASSLATFVFPFLALFLAARGFGVAAVGRLVSLYGAGSLLSGPVGGWLADRIGRRPALLGALVISAALTALAGLLTAPAAVVASVVGLGVAASAYWPPASALVADAVSPDRRAQAYGLLHWGRNIGTAVSFVVGGLLAGIGYGRLFVADAFTTLCFAALVAWRVQETRPAGATVAAGASDGSEPARDAAGAPSLLRDRTLLEFLLLTTAFCVPFYQFMAALPLAMQARGFGPGAYGRVLAVNGVLIGLVQPSISGWARRRDPSRIIALAALCVAAGYGAYAFCRSPLDFGLATAIWTMGEILMLPLASAVVAGLAPEAQRGRYQGALMFAYGVALVIAPWSGTLLLGRAGAPALWGACAVVSGLVAGGQLALRPALRRRMAG